MASTFSFKMGTNIDINVKTINNDVYNMNIARNISILDLKSRIKVISKF